MAGALPGILTTLACVSISVQSFVDALAGAPLNIAIIVVVSLVLTLLLRFLVARVIRRISRIPTRRIDITDSATIEIGAPASRTGQRLRTLQSVLNSTIAVVIGVAAVLMILSELGVAVGPLLASAGVVGVAVAFGAQSLVRDVISGLFMLAEDQFGVGDRVELGATAAVMATGTVEQVGLRVTTLRDDDGKIWHVRNGEILRVSNESQGWAKAVAQIQVEPETDVPAAREVMLAVTSTLQSEEAYRTAILGDPEIQVEEISGAGITLRWSVRTAPGEQWRVASAMRRRVMTAFAERGIELAGE